MKKLYASVISLLLIGSVIGISSIFGAQYTSFGTNTYKVYDAKYNWIEIKSTGTEITYTNNKTTGWTNYDDGYTIIPIGFDFPFYGQNYDTIYLSTNGHIDFVEGLGNPGRNNIDQRIPTGSNLSDASGWGVDPLIAFYFCDLDFNKTEYPTQGHAYYKNFGDYFVIEFDGVPMYWRSSYSNIIPTAGEHTMQVILYRNGNIKIQYKSLTNLVDHYNHATVIGLDLDNVSGVSYDGGIRDRMSLWFTTGAPPAENANLPIAKILDILKKNQED